MIDPFIQAYLWAWILATLATLVQLVLVARSD
jgi:hypothetical protein